MSFSGLCAQDLRGFASAQQQQQLRSPKKAQQLSQSGAADSASADPEVRPHLVELEAALALELKHRGSAQLPRPTPDSGTITCGMRDGSAHVLRCLKVWYDLPSDIFFNAVSSIDRFLAKMKVKR